MKRIIWFLFASFSVLPVVAQTVKETVTTENEITVIFRSEDRTLNPAIQEGLLDIIFKVYPKLIADFNPDARRDLAVKIDTSYQGVAYAHNGEVTISSNWLHNRPEDLDLMTHEVMHIIQSYPSNAGPGWLTEGIADYVRHLYGVDNARARWSLPDYESDHKFTDSYRVTARFLVWISERFDDNLVVKLDNDLRNQNYSGEWWKEYTGKTLEELWSLYSKEPELL